jgi:hypothetical protein
MATYAKMKGKPSAPGTSVGTGGNTRNQPEHAKVPKAKVGSGLPHTFFGNSRGEVHKNFKKHPHD